MPKTIENVTELLIQDSELPIVKLWKKSEYGNKNKFFEFIRELEKQGHVKTRKVGRERLVSLSSPNKKLDYFINNFGERIDFYEKIINKHLIGLKNNKPLVPTIGSPMKKVKVKIPVLEFDKKRQRYRPPGKIDSHFMTWKTRPKARKHFDAVLNLLNRLYHESSVFTFAKQITDDPTLIIGYQKRSSNLINASLNKIENMFRDDPESLGFVITQIRSVLYGLMFRARLEKQIKSE